ncbi:MAG: agmatine deiminase family protein [Planctomycetota bacterium]
MRFYGHLMNGVAVAIAALVLSSAAGAEQAKRVPRDILDGIVDDEPDPLPRHMTPAEQRLPLPLPATRGAAPSGAVDTPTEYEPNEGMLIRWGSYNALLTELTVGVTTGDAEAVVYILVTGASQQASATSTLTSAEADMSQVEFITYSSNSAWIRDYGPRFIFEDENRAIVDHTYNRPRPLDNAFPHHLSGLWGEPEYDLPLVHGGGNFHLFSNGDAFMSDLILTENPGQSARDVMDYFSAYENVDLTIYQGLPTSFDSTQHIDMWMFPVRDNEIIIGEYDSATGAPYTITEGAVADLTSRGYMVYRTPGWNSGGTHYTYTNAVVFNDLVFTSEFGPPYATQDAQARAVFELAFPDHQIIPTDCSSIIHAAGAIHCIVMHVPGYTTTLQVTPGTGLQASGPVGGPFSPDNIVYTLENSSASPIDYSVTGTAAWLSVTNDSGTIGPLSTVPVTVSINSAAESLGAGVYADTVSFVNLTDHDGDTARDVGVVVGVPEPVHVFNLDTNPGWTTTGEWAFGGPSGGGGAAHGYPDPSSGATGANVCGVNLNGDYSLTPGGPYYLTTTALDCSDLVQVSLHFQRWLNTDFQPYVQATLEVSNDGTTWVPVWQNGGSEIAENAWSEQVYDISSIADNAPAVYVRWGYQVSSSAWAYSGWNIDDIEIWGLMPTTCVEDVNGDGAINVLDLIDLLLCFGQPASPGCEPEDIDGDGTVNVLDLIELLLAFGQSCP